MQVYRFILVFVLILIKPWLFYAQNLTDLHQKEDSLVKLVGQIKASSDDSLKIKLNNLLTQYLGQILDQPESFTYSFDSLKQFGRLTSVDKKFRVITWNIILADGSNTYSGYIQTYNEKTKTVKKYQLIDHASDINFRETSVLSAGKWYGGIYYNMLPKKVNQITYYTLLALRYNDLFTTSKIIEVLYFDQFGNPVFGAPIFDDGKQTKLRVVFEYSAKVSMNLNYNKELNRIIFDHLSPEDARYNEKYEDYGPDLSFDTYQFKGNKWKLVTDIELRNTEQKTTPSKKRKSPVSNKIIGR